MKATEASKLVITKKYLVFKNDEFVGVAFGLKEAAKLANCHEKTVRNCLKENRKNRKGFSFKVEV